MIGPRSSSKWLAKFALPLVIASGAAVGESTLLRWSTLGGSAKPSGQAEAAPEGAAPKASPSAENAEGATSKPKATDKKRDRQPADPNAVEMIALEDFDWMPQPEIAVEASSPEPVQEVVVETSEAALWPADAEPEIIVRSPQPAQAEKSPEQQLIADSEPPAQPETVIVAGTSNRQSILDVSLDLAAVLTPAEPATQAADVEARVENIAVAEVAPNEPPTQPEKAAPVAETLIVAGSSDRQSILDVSPALASTDREAAVPQAIVEATPSNKPTAHDAFVASAADEATDVAQVVESEPATGALSTQPQIEPIEVVAPANGIALQSGELQALEEQLTAASEFEPPAAQQEPMEIAGDSDQLSVLEVSPDLLALEPPSNADVVAADAQIAAVDIPALAPILSIDQRVEENAEPAWAQTAAPDANAGYVVDGSYVVESWAERAAPPTDAAQAPVEDAVEGSLDFLGTVAPLGDVEIIDAAEPAGNTTETTPPEEDILSELDEDFSVDAEVLEDAADTEYLEDLGLLASAERAGYHELTDEIAETGLELMETEGSAPSQRQARFGYAAVGSTEAPPMTLDEILELALSSNPEVGAALAREEQAQWSFREAQVYKYPTIDVVAEGGPEYNRTATNTSDNEDITPSRKITLRVTQLLYDGGVSVNESDRRLQVRRSTEIETRLIVEDIVVRASEAYAQILQQQRASAVAQEFVEEMQRIVEKLEVMFESGAASKLELDFAKARLASARAETGNTKAALNDALSELEFLTGTLPEFTAVPPQDVHRLSVANLGEYIDTARRQNAEVLLNESAKHTLRYKIRAQRAQYSPKLSLNMKSEALADAGGNIPARNTTEVKAKVEYLMFDGGARRAQLNRTRAQLKELDYEDERLYNEVDRRVKQAYNQITTNRVTLDATEDEILSNQELRRLNRQNLEMGDISIIELIEAEERLFNSQATWYRVSSEMLQNYYELLVNTGEWTSLINNEITQSRIQDENASRPLK